jgi:hypothetical protein
MAEAVSKAILVADNPYCTWLTNNPAATYRQIAEKRAELIAQNLKPFGIVLRLEWL